MTIDEAIAKTRPLISYTNRNNFTIDDRTKEPYAHLSKINGCNGQLIQTPETVERERRGSCYDQTFLVKTWMDTAGVDSKVFWSATDNLGNENGLHYYNRDTISHVFILCFIDSKWKWIEWSWSANINNKIENATINEVLKSYRQMAENSWHKPIKLIEVPVNQIHLPMPRLDFINKLLENV